jgi:hypothetical protein
VRDLQEQDENGISAAAATGHIGSSCEFYI